MSAPTTPTTQQVADDITADVEAKIAQSVPILPKAFVRVLAKALAGVVILLFKYAGWMFAQWFVRYASMEETEVNGRFIRPLIEWGRLIGAGEPHAPTHAELGIAILVKEQTGVIPQGTQLVYPPTGVVYALKATVALDAQQVGAFIVAVSDPNGGDGSGSIGNIPPGSKVSFANAPPQIQRDALVMVQSVTASSGEEVEDYRARILRRFQNKPQGGAYADYQEWGEELAGILHVYPYTSATPGEVDVYVEATPESSGNSDGFPTLAQRNAVRAIIEADEGGLANRRPANAAVNVHSITRDAFDIRIRGLITEVKDRASAEAAIEQAVDEYLRSREPYIVGLSHLPRTNRITKAGLGGIVDDTVSAFGGSIADVELLQGGDPIPAFTLNNGAKCKLGNVTYI